MIAVASPLPAWWDGVHRMITAAALASEPQGFRGFGDSDTEKLVPQYCLYPDTYRASPPKCGKACGRSANSTAGRSTT